jgi:tRNA threonylcarbamoyladenosine biosynthesis protein TsaB
MSLLLNIDTATSNASVCISKSGETIAISDNDNQKEHATFLHVAIQALFTEASIQISAIDAIAITSGPGSYTGLRVAMAAAKGLCFALNKPLIAVNTLQVMAYAAKEYLNTEDTLHANALLCPMVDARRMEVFTALYNVNLQEIRPPCALILENTSFNMWENNEIYFFGSGSEKFKFFERSRSMFINSPHSARHLAKIASDRFT